MAATCKTAIAIRDEFQSGFFWQLPLEPDRATQRELAQPNELVGQSSFAAFAL